jgi:hypothetical protein
MARGFLNDVSDAHYSLVPAFEHVGRVEAVVVRPAQHRPALGSMT